uniref:Uncharacterized protein n=1 Tax=Helianthus annuus TaxID=4232 RepID=A0A251S3K6_HELAN
MMMVPLVFGFRFQASVREGAGATTHTHTPSRPLNVWLLIRVDVELAVWDAGVVMGRDTWKLETRLEDYIYLGFG